MKQVTEQQHILHAIYELKILRYNAEHPQAVWAYEKAIAILQKEMPQ